MELSAKLKQLREQIGHRRGLGRPLTQSEVARAIRDELGGSISQSYLSQLERGHRVHLTHTSRDHLARFFGVHPGYLVSDPLPDEAMSPTEDEHRGSDIPGSQHHPSHIPFPLVHPRAHQTLARLAMHPRQRQIWMMLDVLLDLPEDAFHQIRRFLDGPYAFEPGSVVKT